MLEKDLFELNGIINRLTGEFHTLMSLSWYIRVMSSVVCWIIIVQSFMVKWSHILIIRHVTDVGYMKIRNEWLPGVLVLFKHTFSHVVVH